MKDEGRRKRKLLSYLLPSSFFLPPSSFTIVALDATAADRLDHHLHVARHLLRPCLVLRKARGQEHLRILRLGAGGPVVVGRAVDGRHDVQQRHPEPGHRHRAPQRRGRQLGVVGVRADGRLDGVFLRAPLAALGSHDRSRVLRDSHTRGVRRGGCAASARFIWACCSTA